MRLTINNTKLKGSITCNNSKSQLLRLLIICAQFKEKITIYDPNYCADVMHLINALQLLGVKIITAKKYLSIEGGTFSYNGFPLDCGESATVLRFLVAFGLLYFKEIRLTGSPRLLARVQSDLSIFCEQEGIKYQSGADYLFLKGIIAGETIKIDSTISSQLASGFALVIPFLNGNLKKIYYHGNNSKSYFLYTLALLKLFNISFIEEYENLFLNKKGLIVAPKILGCEIDYSNLIYYLLLTLKYQVHIKNTLLPSEQPDYMIFTYLKEMGLNYFLINKFINLHIISKKDSILDMGQNPDLVFPLAILAIYLNQDITFINVNRLIYKEANRLEALITFLNQVKQRFQYENNTLTIYQSLNQNWENLVVNGYNDHRIIMSYITFSYLVNADISIDNAANINKSAPEFINNLSRLGAKLKWQIN